MIDAYTIGINLALQDGVSTGIALIRRELDALNATLALSMSGLAQFQHSGVQALSHLSPMALTPVVRGKSLAEAEPVAAKPAGVMAPELVAPVAHARPAEPIISPLIWPKLPEIAPVAAGAGAVVPTPSAAPATAAPIADAPAALGGSELAMLAMSMLPATISAASAPQVENTVLLADTPREDATSGASEVGVAPPPPPGQAIIPAAPSAPLPAVTAPVAPSIAVHEAAMEPARPSMAPQERSSGSTQLSGEITLDGARVGRWMADQLARGAARAPSGGSGHDPRQGMVWPGGRAQS